MLRINQITSYPNQSQNVVLPDGTFFSIQIEFVPMQLGWFITNFAYQTFTLSGLRICVLPDLLYQFKNLVPFGLACATNEKREPTQQQDFASNAFQLYVVTQQEVEQYSTFLST